MANLPISKLTLFSSGVGYFEHCGTVSDTSEILLPFHINAINDALKSFVINDPAGCPAVSYPSEATQKKSMMSLSIDLSGSSIQTMLQSLDGAEIEVFVPDSIRGRILFAERRTENASNADIHKDFLSISTENGIKTICIDDINNFVFIDPKITEDLNRALDLAVKSRDDKSRNLTINLAGDYERKISFSYVIPAAVWKVSYRLNLSNEKPFLQGWAIVDNNSDNDWDNIELALVTGKPVSFVQDLYKLHNISRPTIPLSSEGIADVKTYDSGTKYEPAMRRSKKMTNTEGISLNQDDVDSVFGVLNKHSEFKETDNMSCEPMRIGLADITGLPADKSASDQFEFTIKKPVNLARQQSAMLPLVECDIKAQKFLVFSREGKSINSVYNPAICSELTNNSGMKLPPGPITVYDGGTYAGDALINFFQENEKRLISYGEDLSVTCSFIFNVSEKVSLVKIDNGFITSNKKIIYETVYTFRNAGKESKNILIEHPVNLNASLLNPKEYSEKTHNLHRFTQTLPSSADFINFTVDEEKTVCEKLEITNFKYERLCAYLSNKDIMQDKVRTILQNTFELNEKILKSQETLEDLNDKRKKLIEKQERTRKNLEAAGNKSEHGKDYLQRLVKEDADIDALDEKITVAVNAIETAKKDYENYLLGLKIE